VTQRRVEDKTTAFYGEEKGFIRRERETEIEKWRLKEEERKKKRSTEKESVN
jgi:hypothetical protein